VQEQLPGFGLAAAGGTDHHQTVVEFLDLVELYDFLDEAVLGL